MQQAGHLEKGPYIYPLALSAFAYGFEDGPAVSTGGVRTPPGSSKHTVVADRFIGNQMRPAEKGPCFDL